MRPEQTAYNDPTVLTLPLPTPPSSPLPYPRLVSLTPKFDADI